MPGRSYHLCRNFEFCPSFALLNRILITSLDEVLGEVADSLDWDSNRHFPLPCDQCSLIAWQPSQMMRPIGIALLNLCGLASLRLGVRIGDRRRQPAD